MENFISVILMQYVSILMELTIVSVSQDMKAMDPLTVTVSIIIVILRTSCKPFARSQKNLVSTTLTVSSSLGLVSFLLVGGMVGAVGCICCYVRRYSKANKKNRIYL